MRRLVLLLLVAGLTAGIACASSAQAAPPVPDPYGTHDARGFLNILPPGENGLVNATQLAAWEAAINTNQPNPPRPPHNQDQLGMYANLVYAVPGLTAAKVGNYYKDATFGVKPADVDRTYSPRGDVTIVRDKKFGVAHVYGATRAGAEFGLGYVAAEDRLFFIDILRHLGRAELSSFVGGAQGNRDFDHSEWAVAPYTEADLQRQVDQLPQLYGAAGQQVMDDATNYVAGINQYIAEAKNPIPNPLLPKLPGEYAAINKPAGPDPWKTTDIIATAALVGAIFGGGGGGELNSALALQAAQTKLGARAGKRAWHDFRSQNDPEAPTTVRGRSFPYEHVPKHIAKGSLAMPDPGSNKYQPVQGASAGGGSSAAGTAAASLPAGTCAARGLICLPKGNSNALVVSARKSKSGHPLAVFGPQTGYFAPQILMEEDVHAPAAPGHPGLDARGATFPGVNLYVELGRGRDYAWSATSAGQDITDTFAVPLCKPGGGTPSIDSNFYKYGGKCVQMESLVRSNSWVPNGADQTPPGNETLRAQRTALGLVISRARVKGRPVAYTSQRSTYMHEVDSALGFVDFNDPVAMATPQGFQRAAYKVGYTFNWLFVNSKHNAYLNSGANPVRAKGVDPNFPVWGSKKFEWRGWDPGARTAKYTPAAQHPQSIDQDFQTSWNNKQAPSYSSSDSKWSYSSVFRSQLLDDRIRHGLAGGRKMTLVQLISAMEDAGTADLRGDKDLPLALAILGKQKKGSALARAVATLKAWVRHGAHRRDLNRDGKYDEADAVRIMDAWFPLWISGEFKPVMGASFFNFAKSINEPDNQPNNHGGHLGSAYDDGWYGYVSKDLRQALHRPVRGRWSRTYCGGGSRKACRAMLASTLSQALKVPSSQIYTEHCKQGGDQWCWDSIVMRPLGSITQPNFEWINRPTFQQAVEIQGAAP